MFWMRATRSGLRNVEVNAVVNVVQLIAVVVVIPKALLKDTSN